MPTISILFLNGPLIGYTVVYAGSLLSGALLESTASPNSTIDTTPVITVDTAPDNTIEIVNLLPNYFYVWNISARNQLGSTLPQTVGRTSPSARE